MKVKGDVGFYLKDNMHIYIYINVHILKKSKLIDHDYLA